MRRERVIWQQALHVFRNEFLEHRKDQLNVEQFDAFYQPATAEQLFDRVWRMMADLFPASIEAHYLPNWSIMEIPIDERDPKHPRRWRPFQCAPVDRETFSK